MPIRACGGNFGLFAVRFQADCKLKISIHDSVGVKIYAFSSLSGVEELFVISSALVARFPP